MLRICTYRVFVFFKLFYSGLVCLVGSDIEFRIDIGCIYINIE
jgi:hypothetical protein